MNPTHPIGEPCTCVPGRLCPGCAELLDMLCREPDPLAKIAASFNRDVPRRAVVA